MCSLTKLSYLGSETSKEDDKDLIEAGLMHSEAYVEGDGAHFTSVVICPAFSNKSRIQKQQLVLNILEQKTN